MYEASPPKAPVGKHKAWWKPEVMEPWQREVAAGRKDLKNQNSMENGKAHAKARKTFGIAVKDQKTDRWLQFPPELMQKNLFSANKFAMGKSPSQLIRTLVYKQGKVCDSNAQKSKRVHMTCLVKVPCKLEDILGLIFPLYNNTKLPQNQLPQLLQHIKDEKVEETLFNRSLMKASGPNRTQNWALQKVWPFFKQHIVSLFKVITIHSIISNSWKSERTVMLPKPSKSNHRPEPYSTPQAKPVKYYWQRYSLKILRQ